MNEERICRYCFAGEEPGNTLISPCNCKGTAKYVHTICLKNWRCSNVRAMVYDKCEQCKAYYKLDSGSYFLEFTVFTISLILSLLYMGTFINLSIQLTQDINLLLNDLNVSKKKLIDYTFQTITLVLCFICIKSRDFIFNQITLFSILLRLSIHQMFIDYFSLGVISVFMFFRVFRNIKLTVKRYILRNVL